MGTSLSLRSATALKKTQTTAVSQSQKTLSDLLWLYFPPLQHSDVSLTCHKASQLVFRLLATG